MLRIFEQQIQDAEGLTLPWYDVLIQLYVAPDRRLRMQDLADRVVLSRSGLTRLVDRKEKAGLVRRVHSTEDRRGYYAVLVAEGRRVFLRVRRGYHRDVLEHFTRHLEDADIRALSGALSKVRDANQSASSSGKR